MPQRPQVLKTQIKSMYQSKRIQISTFFSVKSTLRLMKPSNSTPSATLFQPVWLPLRTSLETSMPHSRRSEPKLLQCKDRREIARKPSFSSLYREVKISLRIWGSSTRSEKKTKNSKPRMPPQMRLKEPKPKLRQKNERPFLESQLVFNPRS